eukprot:scaffold2914_cov178-Amphora_coffeaeformis.AAC.20
MDHIMAHTERQKVSYLAVLNAFHLTSNEDQKQVYSMMGWTEDPGEPLCIEIAEESFQYTAKHLFFVESLGSGKYKFAHDIIQTAALGILTQTDHEAEFRHAIGCQLRQYLVTDIKKYVDILRDFGYDKLCDTCNPFFRLVWMLNEADEGLRDEWMSTRGTSSAPKRSKGHLFDMVYALYMNDVEEALRAAKRMGPMTEHKGKIFSWHSGSFFTASCMWRPTNTTGIVCT